MPPINVAADLAKHMRRQMRQIRKLHAGRKLKYVLQGNVITKIDDLAKPMRMMTRLYTQHLSRLHLQIAFHADLLTINRAANAAGQQVLDVLDNFAGGADAVDPVVRRVLAIEAHHFIPATGLRRFTFLQAIFPNEGMMPAVNLLRIEHQGPRHLIEQVANQVGVLAGPRKGMLTDNMTTKLTRIADDVLAMGHLDEKQKALRYLDELVTFYDVEYADVGNGVKLLDSAADLPGHMAGWSARDWIRETRRGLVATPFP